MDTKVGSSAYYSVAHIYSYLQDAPSVFKIPENADRVLGKLQPSPFMLVLLGLLCLNRCK